MQFSLIHTTWTLIGSPATREMRSVMSPSAVLCTGLAISNYQPKLEGGVDRLEIKVQYSGSGVPAPETSKVSNYVLGAV